jgi:hypothetical protein
VKYEQQTSSEEGPAKGLDSPHSGIFSHVERIT